MASESVLRSPGINAEPPASRAGGSGDISGIWQGKPAENQKPVSDMIAFFNNDDKDAGTVTEILKPSTRSNT